MVLRSSTSCTRRAAAARRAGLPPPRRPLTLAALPPAPSPSPRCAAPPRDCCCRASSSSSSAASPPSPSTSPRLRDPRVLRTHLSALSTQLESTTFAFERPPAHDVLVEFTVQYSTRPGQDLWLVGSTPALGEWSTARAVPMAWSAGGVWRAALRLPPDPGVLFYKVFLKTDGAVCAWQSGGNNMVALPRPGEAPPCAVVLAHSCWDATPTASTDAAQAQLMSRFAGVEAAVGQAEAAARAAGLVAKTCLTELLAAREEAALALRFITRRGLVREFERASSGAGVAPSGAGGAVTDREIDDEIAAILERQLNGDSELRRESR